MRYVRSQNGLGDNIYLRAAVLHMLRTSEEPVTVFSRWAEVFDDLQVETLPIKEILERGLEDKVRSVSYPVPRPLPDGLTEFQSRLRNAGIDESIQLRIDWKIRNPRFVAEVKAMAAGRKIFIYQCPRAIRSEAGALLKPRMIAFRNFVAKHSDYFRIKLGHPPYVEDDPSVPCELDLFGKAFIHDTFDICQLGDLFFSQPSFINCMAEALDRRYICMFSMAALMSDISRANTTTPARLFNKRYLASAVYDDE